MFYKKDILCYNNGIFMRHKNAIICIFMYNYRVLTIKIKINIIRKELDDADEC